MRKTWWAAIAAIGLVACRGGAREAAKSAASPMGAAGTITLSIVGTSDIHGRVVGDGTRGGLDTLAGYLKNLRAARARDGGGVVLVDAGDMFQGTLESNAGEGHVITQAMNTLGYAAAAIGNHEFDFGPVGPATTVSSPSEDARGALKARAAEAKFPFLAANIVDTGTSKPVDWPNVRPSVVVESAGVKVGIVGVTTIDTPRTTMAANVVGLEFPPLAEAITREAKALRARGATVIVVAAHAGGDCKHNDDPAHASCDADQEIMFVAQSLDPTLVDVIIAGHTHKAMATRVHGIPVVQAYANATAFDRVDLKVDRATGKVAGATVFPPQDLCVKVVAGTTRCDAASVEKAGGKLEAATYEGAPVVPDQAVRDEAAPAVEAARERREQALGVTFSARIERAHDVESAEGNLFADEMLAAQPDADVAMTNGGGLRADMPAGPLVYGSLYEAYPFDNRFARIKMSGRQLRAVVAANLQKSGGILSLGGVRARAECKGGALEVTLTRVSGKPVKDDEMLVVVVSDFMATGGDGSVAAAGLEEGDVTLLDAPLVREAIGDALKKRGGTIAPGDVYDPAHPRLVYPGQRPVSCK